MKSGLARFIDGFIFAAVVWLFSFLIARYFIKELYLVIICATVVTLGVCFLFKSKDKKSGESQKDNYLALLTAEHFLYHDPQYALDYFFNALKSRYTGAEKKRFFIKINDTVIVVSLSEPLTLKQAVFYYAESLREKAETLVVLCPGVEKNAIGVKNRLTDIKYEIFEKDRVYKLLKSLNKLPDFKAKKLKHIKFKEFVTAALSPNRAKGYLLTSFTLLFGAYFSIYSIYFLCVAAVCLTLALTSKLNILERFKKEKTPDKA